MAANKLVRARPAAKIEAGKRKRQEKSRFQVEKGERTQESMFLISPEIVKTIKFTRRTNDF